MDFSHDLFLNGHYDKCLEALGDILQTDVLEDTFITENNKCVCQCLIELISGDHHQAALDALLNMYDTFCLSSNHAIQALPLQLQLTFLFNCQWYALSTLDKSPQNTNIWEELLGRAASCCLRVSGEAALLEINVSSDPVDSILQKLLTARNNLHQSESTGIFMEFMASTLLIILYNERTSHVSRRIADFINSIMRDSLEMVALGKLYQESPRSEQRKVFKFGLDCGPSTLFHVDIEQACCLAALLGNAATICSKEYKRHRYFSLAKKKWSSLWHYCEAIKRFEKEELSEALGLLLEGLSAPSSVQLQCRYRCLLGQVYSAMGERQKALENFSTVISLDKRNATTYYYQGREYGKIGRQDAMLTSYQNLIMAQRKRHSTQCTAAPLETHILALLHDRTDISKPAAIYLLAVAYGINEMFEDASVAFEKLLNQRNLSSVIDNGFREEEAVVRLPHPVTILHEAAAINLLTGNLTRAEDICRQAISIYPNKEKHIHDQTPTDVHGTKDLQWIRNLLQEEFQMDVEPETPVTYYEDYLSFFEEDVVGLLILADLQRIQDSEEERLTLNQALLLLSKYMARAQKEGKRSEQDAQLALVQALTSKTCLNIARMQTNSKTFADVDRMFKRALSCNSGDKDVLYHYASFLLAANKTADVEKLWHTFFEKKPIVNIEQTQSLALRYLLRTQISKRRNFSDVLSPIDKTKTNRR